MISLGSIQSFLNSRFGTSTRSGANLIDQLVDIVRRTSRRVTRMVSQSELADPSENESGTQRGLAAPGTTCRIPAGLPARARLLEIVYTPLVGRQRCSCSSDGTPPMRQAARPPCVRLSWRGIRPPCEQREAARQEVTPRPRHQTASRPSSPRLEDRILGCEWQSRPWCSADSSPSFRSLSGMLTDGWYPTGNDPRNPRRPVPGTSCHWTLADIYPRCRVAAGSRRGLADDAPRATFPPSTVIHCAELRGSRARMPYVSVMPTPGWFDRTQLLGLVTARLLVWSCSPGAGRCRAGLPSALPLPGPAAEPPGGADGGVRSTRPEGPTLLGRSVARSWQPAVPRPPAGGGAGRPALRCGPRHRSGPLLDRPQPSPELASLVQVGDGIRVRCRWRSRRVISWQRRAG